MRGLLQVIAHGDRNGREQRTELGMAVLRRSGLMVNKKFMIG